jgi:phosphoribosylanthranilate isomerase
MNIKVKICGIQDYVEAKFAIAAGSDYLGFIFVKDSKRSVSVDVVKDIIEKVRGKVSIVGVFKNNNLEEVNSLCEELDFDLVQLHGDEDPDYCQKVIRPVIKTFGLKADFSITNTIKKMKIYDVTYYLIDREQPGIGDTLPLSKATEISKTFPLFFAGGLTPENVSNVVKKVKPFAVDVITGVKTDGKFDFEKMKQFVINAKGATL